LQWGLVNRVITTDALDSAAESLCAEISDCAPLAVAAAKRTIHGIMDETLGMHLEMIEQAPLLRSQDIQEGIQAGIERRKPQWKGM
jgi:enoyl-CoA hydratase/carnithine racemase